MPTQPPAAPLHTPDARPAVKLFTDGACSGNPGPGGWAYILRHDESGAERVEYGSTLSTTNNRMELLAVIEGLEALTEPSEVELHADSKYVLKGLEEWLDAWKARGWRTSAKKPLKNQDLWERLDALRTTHHLRYQWVQGHDNHPENERCDRLAVQAREEIANNPTPR